MINQLLKRKSSKATLLELQKICGFLNFLGKCVIPGRAFTQRLYIHTANDNGKLKPYHYIKLSGEMKKDLRMWKQFLNHPTVYCRQFADFRNQVTAYQVNFFTDASVIRFRGLCYNSWMSQKWNQQFISKMKLDIECLELFALVAAAKAWLHKFRNKKNVFFVTIKTFVGQSTRIQVLV